MESFAAQAMMCGGGWGGRREGVAHLDALGAGVVAAVLGAAVKLSRSTLIWNQFLSDFYA